jgi:ABC-type transport system involved in cytochrome c biogenesis permease subunit
MNQIGHRALVIGFHCMTTGLMIGSLIAQDPASGRRYFRDPKVLLSFGMWLLYVAMLLVRRSTGLRGRRAVYLVEPGLSRHAERLGGECLQLGAQVLNPMNLP